MSEAPINQPLSASQSAASVAWNRRALAWGIVLASALAGLLLAIVWSFEVADGVIGTRIANATLGTDAKTVSLNDGSMLFGVAFAFAAGLAATCTACNFVVFSCVAPLAAQKHTLQRSIWHIMGWMVLGVVIVTALYGAVGALLGRSIPILSTATLPIGTGFPVRLLQSSIVFVSLGLCFLVWGLHTLGLAPNPLSRLTQDRLWLKQLLIGMLIGCFTVGRPFPLFRKAFEYAVDTGNPVFSAGALALQGLGSTLGMLIVLLLLTYGTGGRFERWMRSNGHRVSTITAVSLIVGGVFFITYWGLRVPSYFGVGWFPLMPYR